LLDGAVRYFSLQQCPLEGTERRRACVKLPSGKRYFEVPLEVKNGRHFRPACHLFADMCAASWYGGMAFVHTVGRGTVNKDRFHRHSCDKEDATKEAALMIVRLEMANANSVRRKPFGKEGNHRLLDAATSDFFEVNDEHSDVATLYFDELCDAFGISRLERGAADVPLRVWMRAKAILTSAEAGSEAKNSRWWSIEVDGRKKKKERVCLRMLLTWVGQKRGWHATAQDIPMLEDELKPMAIEDGAGLVLAGLPTTRHMQRWPSFQRMMPPSLFGGSRRSLPERLSESVVKNVRTSWYSPRRRWPRGQIPCFLTDVNTSLGSLRRHLMLSWSVCRPSVAHLLCKTSWSMGA